jgi:hypothetical protein
VVCVCQIPLFHQKTITIITFPIYLYFVSSLSCDLAAPLILHESLVPKFLAHLTLLSSSGSSGRLNRTVAVRVVRLLRGAGVIQISISSLRTIRGVDSSSFLLSLTAGMLSSA